MFLSHRWNEAPIIALDTETSGQYPLESELCEFAALKYINGAVVDSYQTLIKPSKKMNQEVIDIHHITNEMVKDAPAVQQVIKQIHDFVDGGIIIGHHSPFDLGFLTIEFEKNSLRLPKNPALCSSLLARNLIQGVANHRLQTLVKHFKIESETAHRAYADAKACYDVAAHCFRKVGASATIAEIIKAQKHELYWKNYSMNELKSTPAWACLIEAIQTGKAVQITYQGGAKPGQARVVIPRSVVRNPMGDFLVAQDENAAANLKPKRYKLKKISHASL